MRVAADQVFVLCVAGVRVCVLSPGGFMQLAARSGPSNAAAGDVPRHGMACAVWLGLAQHFQAVMRSIFRPVPCLPTSAVSGCGAGRHELSGSLVTNGVQQQRDRPCQCATCWCVLRRASVTVSRPTSPQRAGGCVLQPECCQQPMHSKQLPVPGACCGGRPPARGSLGQGL
jgi:hypothetical protein